MVSTFGKVACCVALLPSAAALGSPNVGPPDLGLGVSLACIFGGMCAAFLFYHWLWTCFQRLSGPATHASSTGGPRRTWTLRKFFGSPKTRPRCLPSDAPC